MRKIAQGQDDLGFRFWAREASAHEAFNIVGEPEMARSELRLSWVKIAERVGHRLRHRIIARTALRLARFFNTDAEFWLNLQKFCDLEVSRRSGRLSEIERQVHPAPPI